MTKAVRIENADTATYQVVVQVWDKRDGGVDELVEEITLAHPTALAEKHLTSTRYLVVKEAAL